MNELLTPILEQEGYKSETYVDTEGKLTIGHGILLPLSDEEKSMLIDFRTENNRFSALDLEEDESLMIANHRLTIMIDELVRIKPIFSKLSETRQIVLANMVYQLGVPRCLAFKNMWKAIENGLFDKASYEMLDSKWYRQMHKADMADGIDEENRVEWLADMMANDKYRERNI